MQDSEQPDQKPERPAEHVQEVADDAAPELIE